jgi:hypothetical protein
MTTGEYSKKHHEKRLYLEVHVEAADPLHFLPWYRDTADCHVVITMNIIVNKNATLLPREYIKECWADK